MISLFIAFAMLGRDYFFDLHCVQVFGRDYFFDLHCV